MNSREYIENHDFGYGREVERIELNKLKLRDIEDVKEYVKNVLENAFICQIDDLYLNFLNEKDSVEICIEEYK